MVSRKPCDSSGRPKISAISRVPSLGSMPTDSTTTSIATSTGRPMVVSSPLITTVSPRRVISVTMPRMNWTLWSSCAFQ